MVSTTPHWPTDRDHKVVEERGPIRTVVNLSLIARIREQLGLLGYYSPETIRRGHLRLEKRA
jgi:hypothetical protein